MVKTISPIVKLAYLCDRLGPYHMAQLKAANKNVKIAAIEFSSKDETYAWDCIESNAGFLRVTLFKDQPITVQTSTTVINRVRSVLDEIQPQVVAISGWACRSSIIALWWCLESKIPTIMMSDSQEHDEPRQWLKEYIKGRIVRLASAGFVGGVPHVSYLKSLGMEENKIMMGCDVVDNAYFDDGSSAARRNAVSVRQQLSLPERYFLVSSRFVYKKNLTTVLRAYAKYLLAAGDQAWQLVLLGDGPLKQDIVRLRDELGLARMVLMPGFKQYGDLPAYYGLAGAFVLASITEQWGLVVNEAMASGLPVIVSSRCGCVPDLVKQGRNGYVFDPYDVKDLAQCLTRVSGDECPRDLMSNESRRIIAEWDLQLFSCNLCKAAQIAKSTPQRAFTCFDKALLWALIHLIRA